MTANKFKLPSMLAFERKLEVSDGLMFSGDWKNIGVEGDAWKAIPITKRQNRSTISGAGTKDDDKKKPNPASSNSDDANLSNDHDTLKLSFSLRVIGALGKPFGCNDPEFGVAIREKVEGFKLSDDMKILAYRFAYNVANGRFLWRNRVGAEAISIRVKLSNDDTLLRFNAYDFSLNEFNKNSNDSNLRKLTEEIEHGLLGDHESFVFINIDAYVKLGCLQHVFPSQEMNMNKDKKEGKVLFKLNNCAAMHNVKIGNAIRTIDTWYPDYEKEGQPIAIEPFGTVTQRGQAYRKSKKEGDLYSLMIAWVNGESLSIEQQAYVAANLIRGGVFSQSDKKD